MHPPRIWKLFCDGAPVGFYTDHCDRPFVTGDMLRDDSDARRHVRSVASSELLELNVGPADVAEPET